MSTALIIFCIVLVLVGAYWVGPPAFELVVSILDLIADLFSNDTD